VNFETIACPGCGSEDNQPFVEVRDRFDVVPGRLFSIVRCTPCGLLYTNPRPDAASIGEFYAAEGYDPFISGSSKRSLRDCIYRFVRFFTMRRKAARAARGLKSGARVLDVGCATGEMLIRLQRRGLYVFGVEPDTKAAEFARQTHQLAVWTGGIEAVPDDAGPFDLITMWHVLEHVNDLRGTLARLRELLAANGRLVIAVPNPRSSDARAYGENWVAWDAPRHLYHFKPAVLLDLLNHSGFRAERKGAVAFDAFYHCLLSERASLTGYARATMRGLLSWLRGSCGGEGSSELYWATKA
jgi:2-polyprenyl-3-methyl-5-hydroxy-6-metoxy-1,4-benzoquinol methylase